MGSCEMQLRAVRLSGNFVIIVFKSIACSEWLEVQRIHHRPSTIDFFDCISSSVLCFCSVPTPPPPPPPPHRSSSRRCPVGSPSQRRRTPGCPGRCLRLAHRVQNTWDPPCHRCHRRDCSWYTAGGRQTELSARKSWQH